MSLLLPTRRSQAVKLQITALNFLLRLVGDVRQYLFRDFLFLHLNIPVFEQLEGMGLPSDEDHAKMAAFGLHSKPHLSR